MALAFRVFLKNHDVCPMKYDNIIRIYPHPKNFIDLNPTFQYAIIFLLKGYLKILTNHVRFFQRRRQWTLCRTLYPDSLWKELYRLMFGRYYDGKIQTAWRRGKMGVWYAECRADYKTICFRHVLFVTYPRKFSAIQLFLLLQTMIRIRLNFSIYLGSTSSKRRLS